LGHISLTRKIVSEMTYIVSSGTLNPTIPSVLNIKYMVFDHALLHSYPYQSTDSNTSTGMI